MSVDIRLSDGIILTLSDDREIVFDGDYDGDMHVLSHAHGDHFITNHTDSLICSQLTADLIRVRLDAQPTVASVPQLIELQNAGHIAGSRAAYVTDPHTEETVLYTGDVCTRDRLYLDGFEPSSADILIIESTYGKPMYEFPSFEETREEIKDWLKSTSDKIRLLFGYSLGRAQKLSLIANRTVDSPIMVSQTIADLNEVVSRYEGEQLPTTEYSSGTELAAGDIVILPSQLNNSNWVESLADDERVIKAGFSGWAVDDSFKYRGSYDVTFPLSDHCDFTELIELIKKVDPTKVYTTHGFTDEFAQYLTTELGYGAQSLKRNQSTLGDF